MNVQLENLPNCITTIRVEVPSDKVSKAWDAIAREYTQYAKLPGYRPGKVPRAIVEAKFKKEIKEELQKRILSDSYREAVAQSNLRVLNVNEVEDVELTPDKTFRFTATIVTAPTFDLPEYKGLPVELPSAEVTETEIDEALERLRDQSADFNDVTGRPLQSGDFAVITYEGTVDGQPVQEAYPTAGKMLSGNADFWLKMSPSAILPGFSANLEGAAEGEVREFDSEVPEDFFLKDLVGKKIHYSVRVNAIKEKVLPELNDEFAEKLVTGKTLADLRDLARTELGNQKEFDIEQQKRTQILTQLLAGVECELPEGMVRSETQRLLGEIVRENQGRGIPDEMIRENQAELLASAGESARDRLKGTFILIRIAEQEKITVSREEFDERIELMAERYNQPADKLRKQLETANALDKIAEEVLTAKVLDFLASSVSVSASAPEAAEEAAG